MSGWTRKINWNHWLRLKVLAIALVTAAVFAGAASAAQFKLDTSGTDPYLQDWTQVQSETSASVGQSSGGVTPTNLARAYVQSSGGVTPTNLARAYMPRDEGVAAATVDGRSFALGDAALGFGLGLMLAAACAVAILHSRRGIRMAHS